MKKYILFLLSFTAFVLFTSCQAPATTGMSTRVNILSDSEIPLSQIRIDDKKIANSLQFIDIITRQNSDGFIIAQVELLNLSKRDLPFQYLFSWYDQYGMEIYPGSRPWQQRVLHGGQSANLQAVSPYSEAVEFKIHIRRILKK